MKKRVKRLRKFESEAILNHDLNQREVTESRLKNVKLQTLFSPSGSMYLEIVGIKVVSC